MPELELYLYSICLTDSSLRRPSSESPKKVNSWQCSFHVISPPKIPSETNFQIIKMKFYRKHNTQNYVRLTRGLISQLANLRILLCCSLSFGRFPGVRILYTDVSEHCQFHLHAFVSKHSVPSSCLRFGTPCPIFMPTFRNTLFHLHAFVLKHSVPSSCRRFETLCPIFMPSFRNTLFHLHAEVSKHSQLYP